MFSETALYWVSRPVVGVYIEAMLRMNILRHTRLPKGAKIIAANHPSTTDPFFVAAVLRQQSYILINQVLFQVPLLGNYLRRSGHIPVVAGSGAAAIEAAVERLREGCTVMIFPEGQISPLDGGFHKAHTGVARLTLLSGAPVVPVGIHLQRERIQSIRSVVRGKEEIGHWYLRGPYHVTVGKPLHFRGDVEDRDQVRKISDLVMHHIIELARESENRMTPGAGNLLNVPGSLAP